MTHIPVYLLLLFSGKHVLTEDLNEVAELSGVRQLVMTTLYLL